MWKTYFWGEKGLGIYVLIGLIKTAPIMSFSMIEFFFDMVNKHFHFDTIKKTEKG